MKFKLTNEEYAVLKVIRSQDTTSIERLRSMFYGETDTLVHSLESYDLIRAVYPQHLYYRATITGKNYIHEIPISSESNVHLDNAIDNHKDHPDKSQKKSDNESKRIKWITIGKIADLIKSFLIFFKSIF